MARTSAGLLLHRRGRDGAVEVLLAHPGGPLWAARDLGAWSLPKGEHGPEEAPEAAAAREWTEELGLPAPAGPWTPLGEVRQGSGKVVRAWAVAGDLDPGDVVPGTFAMEWPPGSGRRPAFPEVDRVRWGPLGWARERLLAAQRPFLDRLEAHLAGPAGPAGGAPTLWTVGYEALPPGPLVAELRGAGVRRVLDVRFRPQSRRPGMSKTRLAAWLREHGMAYEHRRELGTPPDLRALYRAGRVAEGAERFRRHVEATAAGALDALAAELALAPPTALLCLEADPATCHRRVLAEALARRVEGLRVVDL